MIGPLFFCIFINDLPEVLKFSDPYIFADDLKLLAVNVDTKDIQQDLKSVENWVDKNKMSLALDKCFKVEIRVNQHEFILRETAVESSNVIEDLGIHVSKHLTWTTHIDSRISKANKTFYCIRRNLEFNVKLRIKLGLYKSFILPVLPYGLIIRNISRSDLLRLERFQKKVLKWITGNDFNYTEQLRLLNILPLALFLQLIELLMMAKFMHEENDHIKAKIEHPGRTKEYFNLNKTRTENAGGEYTFRTCRLIDRLNQKIEFREMRGLKRGLIEMMWKFFDRVPKQLDKFLRTLGISSHQYPSENSQQQQQQ